MTINSLIQDKNVLFIPIVSMRSYETGEYNVFADGNINRVVYKIYSSKCKSAKVLIPLHSSNESVKALDEFCQRLQLTVQFEKNDFYGTNAKATRTNNSIPTVQYNDYDYVFVEPTYLCYNLLSNNIIDSNKVVFWNLVSNTVNTKISFVDEYDDYNKYISGRCVTFYATPAQQQYYNNGYVDSDLFDVLEEKKTIFIPFRLSDSGYHIKELKEVLDDLANDFNFVVLYTDVNDSKILSESAIYKHVSSDRDVYNTILKSKPIIPMLEKIDDIMHMSIFEFKHFNCPLIMFEQSVIPLENVVYIKDINQLKEAIVSCLI